MGKKRSHDAEDKDEEHIQRKIRKLQKKLEKKQKKKSRRRIILSDSESEACPNDPTDHPEAEAADTPPVAVDAAPICSRPQDLEEVHEDVSSISKEVDQQAPAQELGEDLLLLLGDAPKEDTIMGKEIHKDVALRWQEILAKGLPKESKDKLLQEYHIPANCSLLLAPVLNPEVKSAISDNLVKRDFYMLQKQKQTGIALAALSQATELLLAGENSPKEILKPVSDACRLLCDVLYNDTKSRRSLIISGINSEMKETISETVRDKYLFGENISEKLKSAKTIQKSVADLKQPQKPVPNKNTYTAKKPQFDRNRLNWKASLHQKFTKQDAGKPRQVQRSPKRASRRPPVDRSPSRRTRRR